MKLTKSPRGVYEPEIQEEDVLGQIRALLELNGARVFRAIERVPKCYRCGLWLGSSERGTPDISGYLRTKPIFPFWLEIKRPRRSSVRLAQLDRIALLQQDGCCAGIVKSWEEVKALFGQHGIQFKVG